MSQRPTLFLTNFTSPRLQGPGARYGVLLNPRDFERVDGRIFALTYPNTALFRRLLRDALSERAELNTLGPAMTALKESYEAHLPAVEVDEGRLMASNGVGEVHVKDGDSVLCCCSKAHAALGLCHRVWMVPTLVKAGWDVVLDGVRLPTQ
jgi:hypothetical protein